MWGGDNRLMEGGNLRNTPFSQGLNRCLSSTTRSNNRIKNNGNVTRGVLIILGQIDACRQVVVVLYRLESDLLPKKAEMVHGSWLGENGLKS